MGTALNNVAALDAQKVIWKSLTPQNTSAQQPRATTFCDNDTPPLAPTKAAADFIQVKPSAFTKAE